MIDNDGKNRINTSVSRSVGVPKSVSTQSDVTASFQRKAEQGAQRSRMDITDVGSDDFLSSRIDKMTSGATSEASRSQPLQPMTATNASVPSEPMRSQSEDSTARSSKSRLSSYAPKSATTQADVATSFQRKAEQGVQRSRMSITDVGSDDFLTSRIEKMTSNTKNEDSRSQPLQPITGATSATPSEQIKTAVQNNSGIKTAEYSSSIKAGQRLSEAFLLAQLTNLPLSNSHMSDDAMNAIKEVRNQTRGGRSDLLEAYIAQKPTSEQMKFNQMVVKRQGKASALRKEIKELKHKPLKESGDSIRKEALATYHETMLHYAKRPQSFKDFFSSQIKTSVVPTISTMTGKVGGALSSEDDSGSQAIGMTFTAGQTAYQAGHLAAKGFGKAYVAINEMPFKTAKRITGLPQTARNIGFTVRSQTGEFVQSVRDVGSNVKSIPKKTKSVIDRNVAFAKRAKKTIEQNGLLSKPVLSGALKPVKNVARQGVLLGGRAVAHTTTKGAVTLVKGGVPTIINGTSAVAFGVGSALGRSEDETVQAAGTLMTGVGYGIKTGVTITKTSGYVLKTAVKTSARGAEAVGGAAVKGVNATVKGAEMVAEVGLKDAVHYARQRLQIKAHKALQKSVAETARDVRDFSINVARFFTKHSITALIIVLIGAIMMSAVITPVSIIGGMFSGTFSTIATIAKHIPIIGGLFKDVEVGDVEEFDVSAYLSDKDNGLPKLKDDYIKEVAEYWYNQDCDYLRVRTEGYSDVLGDKSKVDGIETAIRSAFYSDEELVEIIQPIFNALVLAKYDLQPTDKQAEKLLKDIFNSLFPKPKDIPSEKVTEYCGQSSSNGTGTPYHNNRCYKCHNYHADMCTAVAASCPHWHEDTHSSYSCEKCDHEWYTCNAEKIYGGTGRNIGGLYGETVMGNDGNELLVYGHWTGVAVEDAYVEPSTGDNIIRQRQFFRQHGSSVWVNHDCSLCGEHILPKADKIQIVTLTYRNGCTDVNKSGGYWDKSEVYEVGNNAYDEDTDPNTMTLYGATFYINEVCDDATYHFYCGGYQVCEGHTAITITFNLAGYEKLLEENFTKRITELKEKDEDDLSDDDKKELQALIDGKELALEYLKLHNESTIEKSQLNNIDWATKVEDLTSEQKSERDRAISQVGMIGGKTYIDWYYNEISVTPPKEVNWSGCFVCWVKQKPKFANPIQLKKDSNYHYHDNDDKTKFAEEISELDSGDIVFYNVSYSKKDVADRCGYVIGRDSEYLYVIEGYRFDTVQIRKYAFDDSQIIDYSKMGDDYWK